jgi:tetrahydromethanopterin S-methyltransferase subunit G
MAAVLSLRWIRVYTSPGFTDLERSIDDLDQNIEEVCKEMHSILASMETEKSACYFKIKDFRLSADKRLDELEQKLLDELEQIYIKQKSKVQGTTRR